MATPPKVPPRFVPTLTEVVPDVVPVPLQEPLPAQPIAVAAPVPQAPPVSEVVLQPAVHTDPPPFANFTPLQGPEGLEEFLVQRVLQRVDVALDPRLRDAISTVVQEQTRSVLPRLREEIESIVRQLVYEAVADELAHANTTRPFPR